MKLHKKLFSASMALLAGLSFNLPLTTAQSSTHTVQSGEYLQLIANAYGVSIEDLRAWNGLTSDMIFVGDVLVVNGTSTGTATSSTSGVHVVANGDTLSTIAQRYGTTVERLYAWNGLTSDWLNVGDRLVVYGDASASTYVSTTVSSNSGYHTVVAGDTLSGIAAAYGISEADLWDWNGLHTDWLNVGDVLSVSGYVTGVVSNTPVASTPVTNYTTGTYTVVQNDNLYDIALAHGTTVDDLMAMNGLYSTFLQVGDVLAVPVPASETSTTETGTGETTETPATNTNSNTTTNTSTSGIEEVKEDGVKTKHTVVAGDNLWRIANKYGVTVYNLKLWNDLTDDDTIQVGDVLTIKEAVYEAKKHKVTADDTLESLAELHNTSVENLTKWNELQDGQLVVNSEIFVSDPKPALHEVKTGETLMKIADTYSTTIENIRKWNELPAAAVIANGTLVVSDPTGMTQSLLAQPAAETTVEKTTVEETTAE